MFLSTLLILQLFVLLNPLSSVPFLIKLQKHGIDVRGVAKQAVLTAFIVALTISIAGPTLFQLFGITQNSFRVAGGIVIMLLGIETIRGDESDIPSAGGTDNFIAILATPILTGPATMSYITLKTYEFGVLTVVANLIVAFVGVAAVMYILTMMISRVNARLIGILSRILGLFLTALAVEMMAKGFDGLIREAMK
ncbi:MAG: MarC family protein [Planctomycetota bacterium]